MACGSTLGARGQSPKLIFDMSPEQELLALESIPEWGPQVREVGKHPHNQAGQIIA